MKIKKSSLIAIVAGLCALVAGQAQAQSWVAELNYANVNDIRSSDTPNVET